VSGTSCDVIFNGVTAGTVSVSPVVLSPGTSSIDGRRPLPGSGETGEYQRRRLTFIAAAPGGPGNIVVDSNWII